MSQDPKENSFPVDVKQDFEKFRRKLHPAEMVTSLILPGYFIEYRLNSNLQDKLKYAWGVHLAQQAFNVISCVTVGDILTAMWSLNFSSALILPAISIALSMFKAYKFAETFELRAVEKSIAGDLVEGALRSNEILPDLSHQIIPEVIMLPSQVKTAITEQFNANYLELFQASRLAKKGPVGKLMLAIYLIRLSAVFMDEIKETELIDQDLYNFISGITGWFDNFRDQIFPDGRYQFLIDNIRSNLNSCIDSFEQIRPGFMSLLPTLPLEAFIYGIAEILNLESLCQSETDSRLELISNILTEGALSCRATSHINNAAKGAMVIKHLHQKSEFIRYIDVRYPYQIPSEGYFAQPASASIHDLTQFFTSPDRPLYQSQSITFNPGRIWLEGENGVGKSTLLRLLAGTEKPKSGFVNICNLNIRTIAPENRRRVVTYIPSMFTSDRVNSPVIFNILFRLGHVLFDRRSLHEIESYRTASEILGSHAESDLFKNIFTIATTLGVENLLRRNDSNGLSDGQKKLLIMLVVLIRATYIDSMKVVLFDEPAAALSRGNTETIKSALKQPCLDGKVVIVTTHNPRIFEIDPIPYDRHLRIEDGDIHEVKNSAS